MVGELLVEREPKFSKKVNRFLEVFDRQIDENRIKHGFTLVARLLAERWVARVRCFADTRAQRRWRARDPSRRCP